MKRRRLIVFAVVALFLAGLVWVLRPDPLTADERRLVGTWQSMSDVPEPPTTLTLRADRAYECRPPAGAEPAKVVIGRWAVRNGRLVIDWEPNPIRRLLRPLAPRLGLTIEPVESLALQVVRDDRFMVDVARDWWMPYRRVPAR